jgi:putative protease
VKAGKEELFVRIDTLQWLKKIYIASVDRVIINLNRKEWDELDVNATFLQRNKTKLIFELPKFIAESNIVFYKNLCKKIFDAGYKSFMLSHISQKLIMPKGAEILTNENVYVLNDAAAVYLKKEERVTCFSYPLENDFMNLKIARDKSGIVPLYYHPELFYSRMPVKANAFKDDKNNDYQKMVKDGVTIVVPVNPVALLHQRDKLKDVGYNRFLIDLSFEKPSSNAFNTIIKRYKESAQIQPSFSFNFKLGLK